MIIFQPIPVSVPSIISQTDYNLVGPKRDNNKAREFICEMFMESIPMERIGDVYPHFTCATDTNNIKTIFEAVKNHILQAHIQEVVGVGL